MRPLVIDDDRLICQLLAEYLAPHGYDVVAAHTGPEGVAKALSPDIDVVILDVMLPGADGFEVLRKIRARRDVPVLMLTARGSENERIAGLDTGADDYAPKTFSHRELLARLNSLMRRSRRAENGGAVEAAGISIDPAQRLAMRDGVRIELTNCWRTRRSAGPTSRNARSGNLNGDTAGQYTGLARISSALIQ